MRRTPRRVPPRALGSRRIIGDPDRDAANTTTRSADSSQLDLRELASHNRAVLNGGVWYIEGQSFGLVFAELDADGRIVRTSRKEPPSDQRGNGRTWVNLNLWPGFEMTYQQYGRPLGARQEQAMEATVLRRLRHD
jgi:hypothetical protein